MNLKSLCILLATGMGVLCASGLAALPAYEGHYSPNPTPQTKGGGSGYVQWRWIGLRRAGSSSCPAIPGFEPPERLLKQTVACGDDYRRQADDSVSIRELGLDRFCVYKATTDSPQPPKVLPRDLVALKPDRMALSTFGAEPLPPAPLGQEVGQALADQFLNHLRPSAMQLAGTPGVRITFLDSQPDEDAPSTTAPRGMQHGYILTHLAQKLVCYGPCAATIQSRRVLAYDDFDSIREDASKPTPADQGGHVGTITELGQKIFKTVLEWDPTDGPSHLILNLSVGWDAETLSDGLRTDLDARRVAELEPAVQSVYRALQFAAKKGVLVIAAAGNRRGGSLNDSDWPTLPAAWELRRPSHWPFAHGPKLIYAVGGVDRQGLPLPNSRTRGLPQRVAAGDHAAVEVETRDIGSAAYTGAAVLTGTSVSAAVVSSVAAVIWHLRPDLQPAEVMKIIDESGEPREPKADFYAWRDAFPFSLWPAPRLREVSLYKAVERACGENGERCAQTLGSAPHPPEQRPLRLSEYPKLGTLLSGIRSSAAVAAPFRRPASPTLTGPCHPNMVLFTAGGSVPTAPLCPTDQFLGVSGQRWVLPQPGDDPCPKCSLFPPPPASHSVGLSPAVSGSVSSTSPEDMFYDLAIDINPDWNAENTALFGATLDSPATLDIDRFEGGALVKRMTYLIDIEPLSESGLIKVVSGLGDGASLAGCRAQLNFLVTKAGTTLSIQNPVFVVLDSN